MTGAGGSAGDVVVTSRSFGSGAVDPGELLTGHGLRVVRGPVDHDQATLRPLLQNAVAWIAGTAPVTDQHLEAASRLQIVARYGTGVDAVDLEAARRRGVTVTNTPGANATAVAEHTLALMLACLRHVVDGDRRVRDGAWPTMRGRELGALTVGLIGLGEVGRRVAHLTAAFGSTVLAHDPWAAPVDGARMVSVAELVTGADVVSLHRPPHDRPLVDGGFLERLQPDAVLVNTARAALLDEDAVAEALHAGRLGALGADVLSVEDGATSPLLGAPRTVLTPHCAALTDQAMERMGQVAAAEVVRVVVERQPPRHAVVTAKGDHGAARQ